LGGFSSKSARPSPNWSESVFGNGLRLGCKLPERGGEKGGRPKALTGVDPKKIDLARRLYEENHPDYTLASLCKDLLGGISTKTFYRYIAPQSRQ
jgi:hypothetical protein